MLRLAPTLRVESAPDVAVDIVVAMPLSDADAGPRDTLCCGHRLFIAVTEMTELSGSHRSIETTKFIGAQ